jgi:phosphate transport system substrate-binding protein
MLKISVFCLCFNLMFLSFSLSAQVNDDSDSAIFAIQGSNTIGAKLAPALVKGYLESMGGAQTRVVNLGNNESRISSILMNNRAAVNGHQVVAVDIAAHGSSTGFGALKTFEADIAAASRPAKQKEIDSLTVLTDLTSQASEHILAIDGLAIIIHPNNPIEELSVEQVSALFSGEITNWSQLGGNSGRVNIYARDNNSGTWDSFKGMVLGKSTLSYDALRFESNDELSDTVSQDTNGIGFVGLPSVRQAKLIAISAGTAKALKPTRLTVATEDYALSRRLYLYTDDEPSNIHVRPFIQFSLSEEGQKIVAKNGFISQNIDIVEPENYSDLPVGFKQLTETNKRLTVNFRFKQGSAKLDNRALRDIERLVTFAKENPDNRLILIGFGDYKKSHERSKLLSKLRAMAVRRELVKYGVYPKANYGYGEELPVASNQRAAGRFKNRRVEIWLGAKSK